MSDDLKVGLNIRARGKQAQAEIKRTAEAEQLLAKDAKAVGTAATTAGAQVKQAATAQADAVRKAMARTVESIAAVKQGGSDAGNAIKRGMDDGVRAERAAGRETDRLGDRIKRMLRRVGDSGGVFRIMGRAIRGEMSAIKRSIDTTQGKLAALGVGFKIGQAVVGSAQLDRTLIRTQQTAGMTPQQRDQWRGELFTMGRANGNPVEALQQAFDTLIASGLDFSSARAGTHAIDRAMTVTGADPGVLAKALVAGSSAYNIDLSKPGRAVDLLDKMIVAGRLGNAELENLSSIFPKIGSKAAQIKMPFEQTLAFAETLSNVELDPSRLGTLAESTLRLFGNQQYAHQVTKSTGIQFFDKKTGERRNVLDVFGDLKKQYGAQKTDQQRAAWLGKVLKGTDLDTQRGFGVFLAGNKLDQFRSNWRGIENAKGVMDKDIGVNRESATAAAGRVRNTFSEAMDKMARPINAEFAKVGGYMADHFSGKQMLAWGAGAAIGLPMAARMSKGVLGKILGGGANAADTIKGIAVGRALHDSTGTTPVYVTNWSGAPGGGLGGSVAAAESAAGMRVGAGGVAAEAALASRAAPAARGVALMDFAWALPVGFAVKAVNDALKPVADATYASVGRSGDAAQQKALGMSGPELDAYRAVQAETPFGQWIKTHPQKHAWSGGDAYEQWAQQQARERSGAEASRLPVTDPGHASLRDTLQPKDAAARLAVAAPRMPANKIPEIATRGRSAANDANSAEPGADAPRLPVTDPGHASLRGRTRPARADGAPPVLGGTGLPRIDPGHASLRERVPPRDAPDTRDGGDRGLSPVALLAPLVAPGGVAAAAAWMQAMAARIEAATAQSASQGDAPLQQAAQILAEAQRGLAALLGRPLDVRVHADVPWLMAEVDHHFTREARRG